MVESTSPTSSCTEVLDRIHEELEILEGIYADEDVIESQAAVISVPKHMLTKTVEQPEKQEPSLAQQALQE